MTTTNDKVRKMMNASPLRPSAGDQRSQWTGPPHLAAIDHPDGRGLCRGECGDSIEVQLRVRDDVIEEATFRSDGCGGTYAAATITSTLARGRLRAEALSLTAVEVIDRLGPVIEGHEHCAVIAVNALHEAIKDSIRTAAEPWKRLYR